VKAGRCVFCGRLANECWILPCLELDCALRSEDDTLMRTWAKHAGIGLAKYGRVIQAPPKEVASWTLIRARFVSRFDVLRTAPIVSITITWICPSFASCASGAS